MEEISSPHPTTSSIYAENSLELSTFTVSPIPKSIPEALEDLAHSFSIGHGPWRMETSEPWHKEEENSFNYCTYEAEDLEDHEVVDNSFPSIVRCILIAHKVEKELPSFTRLLSAAIKLKSYRIWWKLQECGLSHQIECLKHPTTSHPVIQSGLDWQHYYTCDATVPSFL